MHSCLYEGIVRHCRYTPVRHEFQYRLFLMYLDLAELSAVFRGSWLWSTSRPAVARFKRSDHLGDPTLPLDSCVRDIVQAKIGRRPAGPIRLLTQLRYFGYVMNPVSFYYCFDAGGVQVEAVVAEVHNTPWGEQHAYVLDFRSDGSGSPLQTQHGKEFHVSPFLGMDMEYCWKLTQPGDQLVVGIQNRSREALLFSANLSLRRRELGGWNLSRALIRHPFMTWRITAAIYWQALRLWFKRVPYVPHPGRKFEQEPAA